MRERLLRAGEISQRAIEDGARANQVAPRFMMKGDCQLNQALQVPALLGAAPCRPPNVFEHLMGVEKVRAVEEVKAAHQFDPVVATIGERLSHRGSVTCTVVC